MDLNVLMSAKTFAVVGASANTQKVGHQILRNLKENKELTIFPINQKGGIILDLPVFRQLTDTPSPIEIVIIAVPIGAVIPLIDECIKIKAKAVVLITAGFAEAGKAGAIIQSNIVEKLKNAGIALLGPNSMGYIVPSRQIFASFGPSELASGPIAVISQSGAMLSALFQEYQSAGTGVSFALSLGNRTGYSENDALSFALSDNSTRVIAIYLESLSDPKELLKISKKVSRSKPIFLLKGGVTEEGRSVAVSHTAALATSQILLDDLCHQAGIVQVANFEQLVRASIAASKTTFLPENIFIITNAGGPAVVMTDEISQAGIPQALPPLDLLGDATPEDYESALSKYSNDLSIDAIVAIVTEQAVTDMPGITKVLKRKRGKHLFFVCIAGGDSLDNYRTELKNAGVIVTRYPNEIAETIGSLKLAKTYLNRPVEITKLSKLATNSYPQSYEQLVDLLNKYNLKGPKSELVKDASEIQKVDSLGWPIIAKTTNLRLLHKAKIGAVIQDIGNIVDAKFAYEKLKEWGTSAVFQQKIKSGIEAILGAHHDPVWGWYMAIGMGGSLSDTYDDRAYIFLPASKSEFKEALSRTKLTQLLSSTSKENLIHAMSDLQSCVLSTKELQEIEINPLFVSDSFVIAADLKRA